MSSLQHFADIHPHSSFKYVYNDRDPWRSMNIRHPIFEWITGIAAYTQSDFRRMALGKTEVAFVGLHAVEQRMNFLKVGEVLEDPIERTAFFLTKIPKEKIDFMQTAEYDHYNHILQEKAFLLKHQKDERKLRISGLQYKKCRYQLVNNFEEIRSILDKNRTDKKQFTIAVVLTMEGMYNLGAGHVVFNGVNSFNVSEGTLLNRINNLKGISNDAGEGWPVSPVWVGLSHIFRNGIFGFAQPLKASFKKIFEYAESPGDPDTELNAGITPLGIKLIKRLLCLDELHFEGDRRIHIDIKHLSTRARKDYYELLDAYHADNPDDLIPVIVSHGAVNGKPTIHDQQFNPLDTDEEQKSSTGFNPWSINLYDDEVLRIFRTKGLFGIMLDERILAGDKKIKETPGSGRKKWGRIFADQIEYFVKIVYDSDVENKSTVWNCICIGSDFDGQINPANAFDTAKRFPRLCKTLVEELNDQRFDAFREDYSPEELTSKICFGNALSFLAQRFV